ncbi:NADPH:quinone oxidoreductase family protein [Enterovirga sp.]|uniref:NADPH:quinone oxidoreductase family protein n=1 Tax=Enterovirga sp. TaxID=2026350 RepID=UPI00260A1BB3|nr:NADPH:quinone oxidoreductase family protein [Enterovirga sp.]
MIRAIQIERHCGPEDLVLSEIPSRPVGPGEVRLRVRSAAVNFADSLMISNQYQHKPPLPLIPGMEAGCEVLEVGPGVDHLAPGDRAVGYARFGYFTEEAVMPADHVFRMPAGMSFDEAAAFPISYGTAHVGLEYRARLRPGEVLLVTGAAGGVGIAAVEVGKALGATVIASASTPEKQELARKHGADHVIDSRGDVVAAIRDLTGGVDVVFDPVGGDAFRSALKCIRFEGRILVVGFAGGERQTVPANHVLVKNCDIIGLSWSFYRERKLSIDKRAFADLCRMYEAGQVRPPVTETYPLAEAGRALRRLLDRAAMGKVVLHT